MVGYVTTGNLVSTLAESQDASPIIDDPTNCKMQRVSQLRHHARQNHESLKSPYQCWEKILDLDICKHFVISDLTNCEALSQHYCLKVILRAIASKKLPQETASRVCRGACR